MYERRHQGASLVSLLVVTHFFIWACSSSDPEEAAVTTSGGAGSALPRGGTSSSEGESTSDLGTGGTVDIDEPASNSDGGAAPESGSAGHEPSAGGEVETGSGGTNSEHDPAQASGGAPAMSGAGESNGGMPSAGAPGAGAAGVTESAIGGAATGGSSAGGSAPGGTAAGGTSAVSEPVCDPADDHSTPDMFLPCAVSTALYVCRNCHSNPPVKGAFSSYVTYADIKANAAKIYGVIENGVMPRPPYTMSVWQKTTALNWLGKDGSCAIGAAVSCQ